MLLIFRQTFLKILRIHIGLPMFCSAKNNKSISYYSAVCVYMHVFMYVKVNTCAHACRDKRTTSSAVPQESSSSFEVQLHTSLGSEVSQAGWPTTSVSTTHPEWDYKQH